MAQNLTMLPGASAVRYGFKKYVMTKMETNPKVDFYFTKAKNWQQEIEKLRTIVLDCGLTEELKWGVPLIHLRKVTSF